MQLTGRVVDQGGRPVEGVQVSAPAFNVGALTGRDGRYLLRLPDGLAGRAVTVRAEQVGYAAAEKSVTLTARGNVLDFQLRSAPLELEEVRAAVGQSADAARQSAPATLPMSAQVSARIRVRAGDPGGHRPWPDIPGRYDPDFHTEAYDRIVDNPFLAVGPNPLSTFSIDVDRASYANVRRFLRGGTLPPPDAVRIEELVNYFRYRDPAPGPEEPPFRVTTEVGPAPWQPLHRLVRIGLKARQVDLEDIPPSNLVFLIDVSGSMQSPDKLPLLKTALGMLVEQLRPEDHVAIVVYAGAAGLVLESTPGSEKETIASTLERLEAGGSTAGGAGIRLAYDVAARNHIEGGNNRVILATDGDFNIGPSSDGEMVRLIEQKREQGTFLTVLGFGTGNLKDSKMEKLADHGNGNFAYIDSPLEARKVLVGEMGGTLLTVAKDVKIQVEFNPSRVAGYRLIGYENRLLAAEDFDDDTKDAGELGAGHSVTALYEVVPVGVDGTVELRDPGELRYGERAAPGDAAGSDELLYVKLRWKEPEADRSRRIDQAVLDRPLELGRTGEDFRFAAAVAGWGMLLRGSEHCGGLTFDDVAWLARGALGPDEEGYRAEFLSLVRQSAQLARGVAQDADGGQSR
jgi:Ca-activated chloride channel family protein